MARFAARQHGIVTAGQLRRAALTARQIKRRVEAGRLHRIHKGVYAVGHPELTDHGRVLAAVLAVGDDAVAAVDAAAWLHGCRREPPEDAIDVVVPRLGIRSREGIRVHCVSGWSSSRWTRRHGVPCTSVVETVFDLAARRPAELRRATTQAVVQRKCSRPELEGALERYPGRRGAARLRRLVEGPALRTRSELEELLVDFLHARGFTGWVANARVEGHEVDVLFEDARLVLEADGREFHDNWLSAEDDERKQAALEAAGNRVIRIRWHQLTRLPEQTERRIRGGLPLVH